MTSFLGRSHASLLVVVLIVAALGAGLSSWGTVPAASSAGSLRASASPYLSWFEVPANDSLLGLANPITALVVGWYDASPGAVPVAATLLLDGMNLTSAGFLNRSASTFTLPVGFAFRNGPHFVNFAVMDNYGSVGYHNWTFTVDTIPPFLLVTSPVYPMVPVPAVAVEGTAFPALPMAAPVTVNVTALPAGLTLSTTANTTTGSFSVLTPLTEGVNTLFVNATDRAGNLATDLIPIVRDTTKPPLVVLTPANGFVSPTNLVRVSGLSEFGAFVTVNGFSVIVAPNGTWSVVLALPEGVNIIQVAAADQVGNLNFTGLGILVDSDAPRVVLSSPTTTLTNRKQVVVSGTVTDTMLVALLVNLNPVTVAPDGTFSVTLSLLEGLNPIAVVAVDAARHTTTVRTAVQVDTTAPRVIVTYPPDGFETTGTTTEIRGTVDDRNATVLVNSEMIRPDANGAWAATVALVPGANPITVSAVDAAGNYAAPILIHVTVFSPISDIQNRTSANAQSLDELGAVFRFSIVGLVLIFVAVSFLLYSRMSRRIREDRRVLAALVRELRRKR